MKSNQDYKNAALDALKGHWAPSVLLTFAFFAICAMSSIFGIEEAGSILSCAITICVLLPLTVGMYNAYRNLLLGRSDDIVASAFRIGFNDWARNVGAMLLMTLYILLWTLCLIVPGIIKGISYSLTPFILRDNPELSAKEALGLSEKMMEGRKMDFFLLSLSFIGWHILATLSLCIGYLWLIPYMYTTTVAFYEDVKADYESKRL